MMASTSVFALLLCAIFAVDDAQGLRCNTYLGSHFGHSGAGIETCTYASKCIEKAFIVYGVQTYSMSCDDELQCTGLPDHTCCTREREDTVIRCSSTNFPNWNVSAANFPADCNTNCSTLRRSSA